MMRPYELPQPQYALWYDVGARFGFGIQSVVEVALCDNNHHKIFASQVEGLEQVLKQMAAKRGVLLHFIH